MSISQSEKYKICSAHQPAFLPWLGTIHKVAISDVFVIMDIAKFRKRAFMHRNRIEINGELNFIGLKVNKGADYTICDEVTISQHAESCLEEISNKLENTYKKYKYYSELRDLVKDCIVETKCTDLNTLYYIQLKYICDKLDIKTIIINESDILSKEESIKLDASERLLEHAIRTKSNIYITGENSKDYLDASVFENKNIVHKVQEFNYSSLLSYQNTSTPLTVFHQIACIGFGGLKKELESNQVTGQEIKAEISANINQL